MRPRLPFSILAVVCLFSLLASGQEAKLALPTQTMSRAGLNRPYRAQLEAHGGRAPLRWETVAGTLPPGITLTPAGALEGTPRATGEFQFTVRVSDSSTPPQTDTRELRLRVLAPLAIEWKRPPVVQGGVISGSVAVTNGTDDTYDLTFIAVAVNSIGKAFALGYRHNLLYAGTERLEIPFSSNLPRGSYIVHVDAVGELEAQNAIYRARLQTQQALSVP